MAEKPPILEIGRMAHALERATHNLDHIVDSLGALGMDRAAEAIHDHQEMVRGMAAEINRLAGQHIHEQYQETMYGVGSIFKAILSMPEEAAA